MAGRRDPPEGSTVTANAVIKLGSSQRYEINYDFCKGCGICVSECPCGALDMVPEQI